MKTLYSLIAAISMIALSHLAIAGGKTIAEAQAARSQNKNEHGQYCPKDPSGHGNLLNTMPRDVCVILVGGTMRVQTGDADGNIVEHKRGTPAVASVWDYYSQKTHQYFRAVYLAGDQRKNDMGQSKIIFVKEKVGNNPEQWVARNELWAKGEGTEVVWTSSGANTVFAQNGGRVFNLAGNNKSAAPAATSTTPPVNSASGCDSLSGMAKIACSTGLGKLGTLGK